VDLRARGGQLEVRTKPLHRRRGFTSQRLPRCCGRRRRTARSGGRERRDRKPKSRRASCGSKKSRTNISSWKLRFGGGGAPDHHGGRAPLRLGRRRKWRCCRTTAPAIRSGTSRNKANCCLVQSGRNRAAGPPGNARFGRAAAQEIAARGVRLTRHTDRVRRLTGLVPCQNCSVWPTASSAALRMCPAGCRAPTASFYSVNQPRRSAMGRRAALARNARRRRHRSRFRYDGTTCTNMGRPLAFQYDVILGPRRTGIQIREQHCAPVARRYRPHRHVPVQTPPGR
jgi:hypothetical protein